MLRGCGFRFLAGRSSVRLATRIRHSVWPSGIVGALNQLHWVRHRNIHSSIKVVFPSSLLDYDIPSLPRPLLLADGRDTPMGCLRRVAWHYLHLRVGTATYMRGTGGSSTPRAGLVHLSHMRVVFSSVGGSKYNHIWHYFRGRTHIARALEALLVCFSNNINSSNKGVLLQPSRTVSKAVSP